MTRPTPRSPMDTFMWIKRASEPRLCAQVCVTPRTPTLVYEISPDDGLVRVPLGDALDPCYV